MPLFLLGCAIGALIVAVVTVPLVGPWPVRLRYLLTAPMTDPLHWLAPVPRLEMRAVRLTELDCHDGDVALTANEVDTDRTARITLEHRGCTPAAVAKLDGWLELGTPLLLMAEHDKVHLYGPDGAVTNMHAIREKV